MNFGDVDDNSSFGGGPRLGGSGLGGLFDADGPAPFSGDNSSFKFEQPAKALAPVAATAEGPAPGAPAVLCTMQGKLIIYDSANQPIDKGAMGVAVMSTAHNHHIFLVYGADKKSIAEAVIGSHMQARVDNEFYVVFHDNHKRFCALQLANPAAASDCLNKINNSIQATTPVQTTDLEPGKGSTLAQDGFDVKLHYSGWVRNPDGSAGSLVGSSVSGGGKPIAFKIGSNEAIVGFNKAVVGMRKAGKRRVLMPTALAAGAIEFRQHQTAHP